MGNQKSCRIDMALEVVVIPVADVDRSLRFYSGLGWRLDADMTNGSAFRLVQFTPPGSSCSIQFGTGITTATPGSGGNLYLVVRDILAARGAMAHYGADVSEIFHRSAGMADSAGLDPERRSYASFASFKDPDGNAWLMQEVGVRLPGRVESGLKVFASSAGLANVLRRAAAAHHEHEKQTGVRDPDWPDWYAKYIVQDQTGAPLPL